MAEKVAKLGISRDKDFMLYVKDGAVWRVRRKQPGVPKGKPERVADGGFEMDNNYIYFVDRDGDVSRAKRAVGGQKRKKTRRARRPSASPPPARPRRSRPRRRRPASPPRRPAKKKRQLAKPVGRQPSSARPTRRKRRLHARRFFFCPRSRLTPALVAPARAACPWPRLRQRRGDRPRRRGAAAGWPAGRAVGQLRRLGLAAPGSARRSARTRRRWPPTWSCTARPASRPCPRTGAQATKLVNAVRNSSQRPTSSRLLVQQRHGDDEGVVVAGQLDADGDEGHPQRRRHPGLHVPAGQPQQHQERQHQQRRRAAWPACQPRSRAVFHLIQGSVQPVVLQVAARLARALGQHRAQAHVVGQRRLLVLDRVLHEALVGVGAARHRQADSGTSSAVASAAPAKKRA